MHLNPALCAHQGVGVVRMVVCAKRAQLVRVILLLGSRTVAHACRVSLATKPALLNVTSARLAGLVNPQTLLHAPSVVQGSHLILRGVPSVPHVVRGSTAIW